MPEDDAVRERRRKWERAYERATPEERERMIAQWVADERKARVTAHRKGEAE